MNSKYLKYAVGEIVLVVIGILIALSINNWSEASKEKKFERKMLSQVHLALKNDIEYFENNFQRLYNLDSSIVVFLNLINQKAPFIDSLYDQDRGRWYYLATGIIYQYNPGPYEALKATGVDKITNEELRNELVMLYDFEFPRHKEFIMYYDQDYKKQTDQLFAFQSEPFLKQVEGEIRVYRKFPTNLLRDHDFLLMLNNMKSRAEIQSRAFRNFIPNLYKVDSLLRNELN